jgi:hypothetical protein
LALSAGAVTDNNFDAVFSSEGEPPFLHYEARYQDERGLHQLIVWRVGEVRCRRQTDHVVDSYVEHGEEGEDWSMRIDDHVKKVRTTLNRETLMTLGTVLDWFDLSHGLNRPWGAHQVTTMIRPPSVDAAPVAACDWYTLTQGSETTEICWSPSLRLPVTMKRSSEHTPFWWLVSFDTAPIPLSVVSAPEVGYLLQDMIREVDED